MKQTFILQPEPNQSRVRVMGAIRTAPDGNVVQISEPTRNLDQNARLWAMLHEISACMRLTLIPTPSTRIRWV